MGDFNPRLPTELWLHVLESLADPEFLWTTIRLVSRAHKSYVDRIFVSTYLPTLTISLALPRYDPTTGKLRYRGAVPATEVTFQYAGLDAATARMLLATPTTVRNGESMEQITARGVIEKQRLDEAAMWMWFGRNRGKGALLDVRKDMCWDDTRKLWYWNAEWERLVTKYFSTKAVRRRKVRGSR